MTLGTSASESLSAAGNIFVGQTEAPLLVRPFMPEMTDSELFCVMAGGFATIAGGVLGLFIAIGIGVISKKVINYPSEGCIKNNQELTLNKVKNHFFI